MPMFSNYNCNDSRFCRCVDMLRFSRVKHTIAAVVVLLIAIDFLLYGSVLKIFSFLSYGDIRMTYAKHAERYLPKWESLDTRPLPQWFDEAKFGIFITWGVYSVPGYGNERFWHNWRDGDPDVVKFMKENYPPDFTYGDFAASFGAELFSPNQWAEILKASGARYNVTIALAEFMFRLEKRLTL